MLVEISDTFFNDIRNSPYGNEIEIVCSDEIQTKSDTKCLPDGEGEYDTNQHGYEVKDKVDGLEEFQKNLSISNIKINEILKVMSRVKERQVKTVCKKLIESLKDDPAWMTDLDFEISFEKFFCTNFFSVQEKENQDLIDWDALTFFVLYTCKEINNQANYSNKHLIERLV